MWNSHHQSIELRNCVHKYYVKNWCVFLKKTCINAKANQERVSRTCLVEPSASCVSAAADNDSDGDGDVLFKKIISFIYLWLCWVFIAMRALSNCSEPGYSPTASFSFWWLLLLQLPLSRHNSCAWASLPHGMWDLPGPGMEPVSHALAGGLLTTETPGEPRNVLLEEGLSKVSGTWDKKLAARHLQS